MHLETPENSYAEVTVDTIGEAMLELQESTDGFAVIDVDDGHFLQTVCRQGDRYSLRYRESLDDPLCRARVPSQLGPRRLARLFHTFSESPERLDSVGWTTVDETPWDFYYFYGEEFDDPLADEVIASLHEFADSRVWRLQPMEVVDDRVGRGGGPPVIGLHYPIGKTEPRTGPTVDDIRCIIEYLGEVYDRTGLEFVLGGANPDSGTTEDWLTVDSPDPPVRDILIRMGENYDSTGRIMFI